MVTDKALNTKRLPVLSMCQYKIKGIFVQLADLKCSLRGEYSI